jgi:hypothetical protein
MTINRMPTHFQSGHSQADGELELFPNSPNPFIEMTMLPFRLPEATEVVLRVFDGLGKEISTIAGAFAKGDNHIVLRRSDLKEPGFYIYQLETPYGTASRKLMMY